MGTLTVDHTIVASDVNELFTFPFEFHTLNTAVLQTIDRSSPRPHTYGMIGILAGGTTLAHAVAILARGYVTPLNPLSWTGTIHVQPDFFLFGLLNGIFANQYRLSGILWKTRIDEKGEFRADP